MGLSYPLLNSRWELEDYSRRRAAGVFYGENRMLCRLLGDYLAFVDTRDLMLAPRLVLDGFWEAWVTLALGRYIQPGFHCVDVGANYGYYTLLMAAACERGGRVLACEPNPLLAETYLPRNVALNGFQERVEVCGRSSGTSTTSRWTSFCTTATTEHPRWNAGPIPTARRKSSCPRPPSTAP